MVIWIRHGWHTDGLSAHKENEMNPTPPKDDWIEGLLWSISGITREDGEAARKEAAAIIRQKLREAELNAKISQLQIIINQITQLNGKLWEQGTITGSALVNMRNALTSEDKDE
jgi:hypothetical protein